jgi:hypothetical protein
MKSHTQIRKALVATLALASLLASPAVARTLSKHHEQLLPDHALGGSLKIIQDPNVVIEDGRVIGRDPDPNVRLQMRRDCCDNY